jgi:cysteine desulfurase/selenocysteine lyase
VIGPGSGRAGIISFVAEWGHTSDIAMILDQCNVFVRSGHHCCQPLMDRLGVDSTIRMSFGLYNSKNDIDQCIEALEKAKGMLG